MTGGRERRWRGMDRLDSRNRPPRSLLVALVPASVTLITPDFHGGTDSPVEPARRVLGEAFGPVESGAAAVIRPFTAVPSWFRAKGSLSDEVRKLEAENSDLRSRVATAGPGPGTGSRSTTASPSPPRASAGPPVPARVVAYGSSQSFSNTVTIDAGSQSGIGPDMTVINNDGLVGRVLRVTRTTATVLLIIDKESNVGGRVGSSPEIGFVKGPGSLADDELELHLVDDAVVPAKHDTVVTWGSAEGALSARRPGRPGHRRLHQPDREQPARRDRAVRQLLRARRGRRDGADRDDQRPCGHRGRRSAAMTRVPGGRRCPRPSPRHWSFRSPCSRTSRGTASSPTSACSSSWPLRSRSTPPRRCCSASPRAWPSTSSRPPTTSPDVGRWR
ncbi:rod shape-determining protein MreC [Nocardioides sp. B-3]|uniref:rod shape-determining protein MreC n=1 Tax=Nocardioides sp. B-3 TaxID=2895565 RepID=UPI0021521125|nr:rod shape-determining protein MreC [Nocardioides sp. B-3]UUZ60031.1 rod shape-determining protein MreC [Nocardioides sp. B-3]